MAQKPLVAKEIPPAKFDKLMDIILGEDWDLLERLAKV
jgi:hypothetical protein